MAKGRILFAHDGPLAERAKELLDQSSEGIDVVPLGDGALCVSAFTRLASAGKPPVLVIVDSALPKVSGLNVVRAIRAVERALGQKAIPVLLYSPEAPDDELKRFLSEVGRTVHLQRAERQSEDEQARRLVVAVERLLQQLRGK